ncbi:MAG: hypothetical protein ACR2OC_01000 [Solirubrobacterales bacterium]
MPTRLASEMERALRALARGVAARDRTTAADAAIDVAQSSLDFQLRYREPTEIDIARFGLWARQAVVDSAAGDVGGVRGDVTTMEWIRDRFADAIDPAERTAIDAHLAVLRDAVANEEEDLEAATAEAKQLEQPLELEPVPLSD